MTPEQELAFGGPLRPDAAMALSLYTLCPKAEAAALHSAYSVDRHEMEL